MIFSGNTRVYIYTGSIDMRNSIDGLSAKVKGLMNQNPFTGDLYWYMRYLFDHLPGFKTKDDFKAFMPQVMDKTVLEDYIKKTNIQDQENLKIALEQSHTEK